MVSAINTAITGLDAASKRLQNSANNIANQFSTSTILNGQEVEKPFTPQQIQQVSLPTGGVKTVAKNADPASVRFYDPSNPASDENGLVEFPNVDTARELINTQIASYDFKANLKTIQAEDNMQKKLLDIIS